MSDNQKIQVMKKLNLRNIVLPKQKTSSSTTRNNIRIKMSNPISYTLSNKMLPISRNKPQNKLLAYTLNSIRDKYQTINGSVRNNRTSINTSVSHTNHNPCNKTKNTNMPSSFTLYSKGNSTSRNKNISNRLFNITNPVNNSLNTLNTMANERSIINHSTYSPSFNTSINSSFQRTTINQSKLHNKKIIMKPYPSEQGYISLIDRKKQLINQEVEKENQRDSIEQLRKIPFVNRFIKTKILFLWINYKRYREYADNRKQLANRIKDNYALFDERLKQSMNELSQVITINRPSLLYQEILPQNYEAFFNDHIKQMDKLLSRLLIVKRGNNNNELQLNKKVFSKLPFQAKKNSKLLKQTNSFKDKDKDKDIDKGKANIKEDYRLSSALHYNFITAIQQLENAIFHSTFTIDHVFIQNELLQRPSQLQLMNPIDTMIQLCSKAYTDKLSLNQQSPPQLLLLKRLIEENNLKVSQYRAEYLKCFHNLSQCSFAKINILKSTISNQLFNNSFKKAKDFLISSLSTSIQKESEEIINKINTLNDSLNISDEFTLSNIQIIKSKLVALTKRIEKSASLTNEEMITKRLEQLKNKIDDCSITIKGKYPMERIRNEIEIIIQSKDYSKLVEFIEAVLVHQNILYDKLDDVLSNLPLYFNAYSNDDVLLKVSFLYSEMSKKNTYNTSEEYFKKTYERYDQLISSISNSNDDNNESSFGLTSFFYEQLNLLLSLRENIIEFYNKNKKENENDTHQHQLNTLHNQFIQNENQVNQLLLRFVIKVNHINTNCANSNSDNGNGNGNCNKLLSQKEISELLEKHQKIAMTINLIDTINPSLSFEVIYTKYINQKLKYKKLLQFSNQHLQLAIINHKEDEDLLSTLSDLSNEFNASQTKMIRSSLALYQQTKSNIHLSNIKTVIKLTTQEKKINLYLSYSKFHLIEEEELNQYEKGIITHTSIKAIYSKTNPNRELMLSESNSSIIGVASMKEKLIFNREIQIDSKTLLKKTKSQLAYLASLFTSIDNEIALVLNKQIIDSLNSFNSKPFHQWCNSFLSQVTVCTLSLIFTNEITQILVNAQNCTSNINSSSNNNQNNKKLSSCNLKNEYEQIIEKYNQWLKLKDKMGESTRPNIVLTLINHLNIIHHLIKTNTTNFESFDWLKYLRHLWDQSKKEVIIECGGWSNYQLKSFITYDRILLTPDTDKIFLFNSSCFREKSASFIKITNNAIGYKEIFQEYAALFWAEMLPINIFNVNCVNRVKALFDIATISRSWIFLENIDAIDNRDGINYLVYLSKFMQVIQQEVILNDIKFNNSERMFCLMGCIKINDRIKLKENALKSSSRVMNFIKPDPEFYIRNVLVYFGIKTIKRDIGKIISILQKKETSIKMEEEQFYFDFNYFNMMIRLILINNTAVTESNMIGFITEFSKDRTMTSFKVKSSSNENAYADETMKERIRAYCDDNHILYNQEFIDAQEYLVDYCTNSNSNSSRKPIPVIVGNCNSTLIEALFSFINRSNNKKRSCITIHQDSLNDYLFKFISNTNCGSSCNSMSITLIELIFWPRELSLLHINNSKTIIKLKAYDEALISELNPKQFKVLHISKPKNKKLLRIYIERINRVLTEMNVVISDEHSSSLTEYINAILKSINKEHEEGFSCSLNEFYAWTIKFIEYHSSNNIQFDIKTLYNIVIQAMLLTVPYLNKDCSNEFINHLSFFSKKFIKEELANEFLSFYDSKYNKNEYIYYDSILKHFISVDYENYKLRMVKLAKQVITKDRVLIVTNDNLIQSSISNGCIVINDMCFNDSVIEFYYSSSSATSSESLSLKEGNAISKRNKNRINANEQYSQFGIYTVLSIDKWKNVEHVFSNTLKLFLFNNQSTSSSVSDSSSSRDYNLQMYISNEYSVVYNQILKLFKVRPNQEEEKYIYSLIDYSNAPNNNIDIDYTQINYNTIFSTMFKENKLFLSIIISFNTEREMKLFSLIKKYFAEYDVIYSNKKKKIAKGNKSNTTVFLNLNKPNDNQQHQYISNASLISFDQRTSIALVNYILSNKLSEVKCIREIAKKGNVNQYQTNISLSLAPESIIDSNKSLITKMLYDTLLLDEIAFNHQYSNCDLIKQVIHYLLQSIVDSKLYSNFFLRYSDLSTYSQTRLLFNYLIHNRFKPSFFSIVSFSLAVESCDQSTKYSNELTMIILHTLTNYSHLISQPEIVNSQLFFINLIHSQSPKKQSLINTLLEKIYLSVANHFLFSLLLTLEIMMNNFEMSKTDLQYCIGFLKDNFVFHNNNSIKFKYDPLDTKEYSQLKGRELIELYQSKSEGYSIGFVSLVEKSLGVYSKYFYTSNLNTISNDVDKLLYYMIFIPEQSPSIFKYLINKYLRPLYCIEKFKVNAFLKKKSSVPITIKADTCINITNFLCSLAAYYEIQFIVIRALDFGVNNSHDLGYKYIVDSNITKLITEAMAKGNWLFVSTEVNLVQFLKVIDMINGNSQMQPHATFKLFFDQNLVKAECNGTIANYTLLLQIDNNNIDDLEAAHDMWVNVLEENILTESMMDETQKDFLDLNSGIKNNISAISDKDYSEVEILKEDSDLTFLTKI